MKREILGALGSGYALMGVTILIQFVLVPLYLQHLGKEAFGILVLLLAAINYGAIGITWLSGGMARILGERVAAGSSSELADAYAFSKYVYLVYAVVTVAAFALLMPWLVRDESYSADVHYAVALACLYFIVLYEYNADRLAFIALCRQTAGNSVEAAGQIVFALGVATALHLGGGLATVIAAQIAGLLVTRSLAWVYWRKEGFPLRWRWPLSSSAHLWKRVTGKMGRDYVLYGILLLTLQADVLIIGWLAGPEVAAAYYLLWRVPEVCALMLGRIPGVFSPHLIQMDSRGEAVRIQDSYHKGLKIMLALSALAGLGYATAGSWFVHYWVGDNAPPGFIPYILAGAALFFIAVSQWPAAIAYALVKTGPLVRITGLYLAVKLAIIFLFFEKLGYLTPVIAIIVTHMLGVFFLYLKMGKEASTASNFTSLKY